MRRSRTRRIWRRWRCRQISLALICWSRYLFVLIPSLKLLRYAQVMSGRSIQVFLFLITMRLTLWICRIASLSRRITRRLMSTFTRITLTIMLTMTNISTTHCRRSLSLRLCRRFLVMSFLVIVRARRIVLILLCVVLLLIITLTGSTSRLSAVRIRLRITDMLAMMRDILMPARRMGRSTLVWTRILTRRFLCCTRLLLRYIRQ